MPDNPRPQPQLVEEQRSLTGAALSAAAGLGGGILGAAGKDIYDKAKATVTSTTTEDPRVDTTGTLEAPTQPSSGEPPIL